MSEHVAPSTHRAALARLFATDYRAEAERTTGHPFQGHTDTRHRAVLLGLSGVRDRRALLQELDDTTWGGTVGTFERIAAEEGFVPCNRHRFCDGALTADHPEYHQILWHPDGVIITADTWGATAINQATLWFNLAVDADAMDRPLLRHSDGAVVETATTHLWAGRAGADEGLRFQMASLRALGDLMWPWARRPKGFHLLNRVEAEGDQRPGTPDVAFMNEARAATSPILSTAWNAPA